MPEGRVDWFLAFGGQRAGLSPWPPTPAIGGWGGRRRAGPRQPPATRDGRPSSEGGTAAKGGDGGAGDEGYVGHGVA